MICIIYCFFNGIIVIIIINIIIIYIIIFVINIIITNIIIINILYNYSYHHILLLILFAHPDVIVVGEL